MRRREFIALICGAAVWPHGTRAQAGGPRRVGLVMGYDRESAEAQSLVTAFREGLEKLGLRDGHEIKIDYRWTGATDPARMKQVTEELVALRPDLIVSSGSPTTVWLLRETKTIPIIFVQVVDPVAQGFAASLSHPGGNATGTANFEASMAGKWIELLKSVSPQLTRVAIPFNPASAPYADIYLRYFRSIAPSFGVEVVAPAIADLAALDSFCAAQVGDAATAVIPMPSGFVSGHVSEIATIMVQHRLPSLYVIRAYAQAGGLLSYGNNISENFRTAATFVDRILKGEKPSELPIQFPVNFELVVNIKTAKQLGLHIPQQLLATADEVIE
jgi:putative tryptophan/tyrosine transport system substrate-binding protein